MPVIFKQNIGNENADLY